MSHQGCEGWFPRRCELCDRRILSDPGAWGTYAMCSRCFNAFARVGTSPPTNPRALTRFVQNGTLTWQAATGKRVVVNPTK